MSREWEKDIIPKHLKGKNDKNELNNIKYRRIKNQIKAEQEIVFFKNNDECPTCEQHIDEKFKEKL